jgi:hypothetical protein
MKKILLIILSVMGAAGLTRVQAQLLNVNFIDDSINLAYGGSNDPAPSAMSGAAVIGSAGDIWNGLGGFTYATPPYGGGATFTSGTLRYATGAASGITLSLSAPSGTYDANSPGFGNHSPFSWTSLANETNNSGYPATPWAALMATCLVANSASATGFVTLSGLTSNGVYNLYTYNASDQNEVAGRASTFTVNGVTQTSTYDGATTTLVNGVDYLEFAGVVASGTGTLTIDFGDEINSESDFNGFQLQFVGGLPPPAAPILSSLASISKATLCTNTTLSVTATESGGATISSFTVITKTSLLGSSTITTNTITYSANSPPVVSGLGTASAALNYPLTANLIYSATITVTANNGLSNSVSANFDTLSPALVIEASDFNFSGGSFFDTPANGGVALYYGQVGEQNIDENKNPANGDQADKGYYRSNDPVVTANANPSTKTEQKFVKEALNGDTTNVEQEVGYNGVGDWLDYSRSYGSAASNSAPAGAYNVWLYMTTDGSGIQSTLSQVTSSPMASGQTTTTLGNFGTPSFVLSDGSWSAYEYLPLVDQFGNLVSVNLGSGVQTLRSTVVGNPNLGFYMLMPVTPVYTPALQFSYPDGLHPFEPTNHLTFTVGPANGSNILSSGIHLVLNGVDVTSSSGFKLTQAGTSWTASYPIQTNGVYAAVINVTNTAGLFSTFTISFDTFNEYPINYQWECVDYDYTANGTSGLFIDNPVPTCDITAPSTGTLEPNSYYGYPAGNPSDIALQGTDINYILTDGGQQSWYRADGVGNSPAADYERAQFRAETNVLHDPNIAPFALGWFNGGDWLNYTRTYPTNNFYVWARLAGGAGPFSGTLLSMVTNGYGTPTQSSNVLGSFSDPNAAGWAAWHWIPLVDTNGHQVAVSLGGQATLTLTSGGNLNAEFLMLVAAPPPQFSITGALSGGQFNVSFLASSGYTYKVLYTPSLTTQPIVWTQQGATINGNGATNTIAQTAGPGYYEVLAQ